MLGYLLRRLLQMLLVVFLSAAASYALLNMAPGGPLAGLRQQQQTNRMRITEEDIARIRAYFELDLNLPLRFSRWMIGQPRGPIIIGGYEFFGDVQIGCRKPIEKTIRTENGGFDTTIIGCKEPEYLRDLAGRRSSNGVLLGDFGDSWKITRGRPVSDLILGRVWKTVELAGLITMVIKQKSPTRFCASGLGVALFSCLGRHRLSLVNGVQLNYSTPAVRSSLSSSLVASFRLSSLSLSII
ncbi:MAG: hypothetical protein HGA86_01610, partial [Anaerolineaceae bacterium]|nr:hypothetical protein [Anaerolineaceae bacterium]